jgi:hypothetical protein
VCLLQSTDFTIAIATTVNATAIVIVKLTTRKLAITAVAVIVTHIVSGQDMGLCASHLVD